MPVTLSALIVAAMPALFQGAVASQATGASSPVVRSLSSRDSTRALRVARRAQDQFESLRRRLLPYEPLDGGDCDAVVSGFCYRREFAAPSGEVPEVIAARTRLLATLDSVGAMIPGDRWILGQRLRYFFEAGRPLAADSMAITCAARSGIAATASWCLALIGYTAQQLGNYPRADAAFTAALAEMPEVERCKWEDLATFLGRSARPYRRDECQARDSITAGFWRLVQPLYLNTANDLRTEMLARITRMYIEQHSSTPMSDWGRSGERQTLLRYGVPLWYSQGDPPRGRVRPRIAGFVRQPAFNFFPDARVFASAEQLTADDWDFTNPENAPTYAPLWATSFQPITDHQVALFRRGDSAFIVAAFDANDGAPAGATRQAGVFAAVIDQGGVLTPFGTTTKPAGVGVVSTLVAPWRPLIVSLEMLNPSRGLAARARFAPRLPLATSRLGLSDLLLYTPRDSAPASLAEAIPRVLHALRAPSDRHVGVFWETYGVHPQGEHVDYALLVTPEDEGVVHRALVKLHVLKPDRSVSLQWSEVETSANGIASRGLTVDLSRLRPGRYSMQLTLTSGTDLPIVAERSIEVL